MTTFPGSPRLYKGGMVLMDAKTAIVQRIISLQYNPETLTRTLKAKGVGETGDRSEALRLIGPPIETIKLDAEIDAADQLEFPSQNPITAKLGIYPQLAALEIMLYPASSQMQTNHSIAQSGMLEIIPMQAPLTLFVWSDKRILPVRLTEFSITEQAFDPALNPLRAKVSLGMQVLNINDLGFSHHGGSLFMAYHKQMESLARMNRGGGLDTLGIGGIP